MKGRIYLDFAATTPVRDEVVAAMLPHLGSLGYNPSSLHAEGRAARAALDAARATVAALLGVRAREIVFTGGGSEADSLAIFGAARAQRRAGSHVITVATEHHAVLQAVRALRDEGCDVTVLPVDEQGRLDPAAFAAALRPGTVLASVMAVNNEIGTLHPIPGLGKLCRARGVLLHCDAVQAPGRLPLPELAAHVDLLSFSAHKFYGPKGVGALYVRAGTPLAPLVLGGGQEAGLRAGTENVAGIVGFARALELAVREEPAETVRLAALRDDFEAEVGRRIPGTRINGERAPRVPNISSLSFAGIDARTLLIRLDLDGLAISAGSACAAGSLEPSHVLEALGLEPAQRNGTLRFSFGRLTTSADARQALELVVTGVAALRDASPEMGTSEFGTLTTMQG